MLSKKEKKRATIDERMLVPTPLNIIKSTLAFPSQNTPYLSPLDDKRLPPMNDSRRWKTLQDKLKKWPLIEVWH